MNDWIALLSNFGVGGGLAFLFAWYLIKSLIPSLTQSNEEQREAFLLALREERADFLNALEGLRETQERFTSEISQNLSTLAEEVKGSAKLVAYLAGNPNPASSEQTKG